MENGHTNGHHPAESAMRLTRFSDIPSAIDIPVKGGQTDEAVELSLEELPEDPTELCDLLDTEEVAKGYWTTIALAYAKQRKMDLAENIVNKGLAALSRSKPEDKLGLYHCLCWLQLIKIREAPRTRLGRRDFTSR
jgi:RNA polymerase-associated protein CTR9